MWFLLVGSWYPPPKIAINLPRTYSVKENHIGSAVNEIPRYKQTQRQTNILLLYYKDNNIDMKGVISDQLALCVIAR